jgi:hypothetical protein
MCDARDDAICTPARNIIFFSSRSDRWLRADREEKTRFKN